MFWALHLVELNSRVDFEHEKVDSGVAMGAESFVLEVFRVHSAIF